MTHLVVVLHDGPLSCARIDPSDEIFHVSSDQHGGVRYWRWSNSDVSLFDCPYSL